MQGKERSRTARQASWRRWYVALCIFVVGSLGSTAGYTQEANGTKLSYWAGEFIRIGQRQSQFGWKDIVEDYEPVDIP